MSPRTDTVVAFIAALLVGALAGASDYLRTDSGFRARIRSSGTLQVSDRTLCANLAGDDLAGAWWCLQGDGGMAPGSSQTLVATSTSTLPAVVTGITCGGSGCVNESMIRFNAGLEAGAAQPTQYFATADAVAAPTGNFTTCVLGTVDTVGGSTTNYDSTEGLIQFSNMDGGTPASAWRIGINTGSDLNIFLNNVDVAGDGVGGKWRVQTLWCGIYQTGGTVTGCSYTQGEAAAVCGAPSAPAGNINGTARRWVVGGDITINAAASLGWTGFSRGVLFTEKAFVLADVTRIGQRVLPPNPTGMTFARASRRTCGDEDDEGSDGPGLIVLPNNVPCTISGVTQVEPATTNLMGRNVIDGSVFSGGAGAPSRIEQYFWSPFGTYVAVRGAMATTTAAQMSSFFNGAFAATNGTARFRTRVRGGFPWDICIRDNVTLVSVCNSCASGAGAWTNCSVERTDLGANAYNVYLGHASLLSGVAYADNYQGRYMYGSQLEDGAAMTSFIQNWNGNITRAVETCTGTGCP